jgi:hypothetical protein
VAGGAAAEFPRGEFAFSVSLGCMDAPSANLDSDNTRSDYVKWRKLTPFIWMNLDFEFKRAYREKGEAIRKEVQPSAA